MPHFPKNMLAPITRLILQQLQDTAEINREQLYQALSCDAQLNEKIKALAKSSSYADILSNLIDWFSNELIKQSPSARPYLRHIHIIRVCESGHYAWVYRLPASTDSQQNMLVLNIAWMQAYQGMDQDSVQSQAGFIRQEQMGYEIYNFLPIDDHVYGFVQPGGYRKPYLQRQICLEKIDPSLGYGADYLDRVLVLWVAPKPGGGTYLVGWYQNARVYRHYQHNKLLSQRAYQGSILGYFVQAQATDAVCLDPSLRTQILQRANRAGRYAGGLGHACVWFAQPDPLRPYNALFRQQAVEFIQHFYNYQRLQQFEQAIAESDPSGRAERLKTASKKPKRIQVLTQQFIRNPDVVAEVLDRAKGVCEICSQAAPFRRLRDNSPYLEVHHCIPLAQGGDDSVENAKALCPNCHRRQHYGHKAF